MEINPRITRTSGWIGVMLIVAGGVVWNAMAEPGWIPTVLAALAALHLAVFFIGHFEALKAVSARRSTRLGVNSVLMVVLFIVILTLLNFISARHAARFDLSSAGDFTLSPQTIRLLKGLKKEVRVLAFFPERSPGVQAARDLLEGYRFQSSRVKYEIIDPDKNPERARQYKVTEPETLVVESGAQIATAKAASEQEVTSALIRASRDTKKTLYFVEGHGEHALEEMERQGYSFLKVALEGQGFAVKALSLLAAKSVPNDAAVVVLGGPQRAFADVERAALGDYLARGGQMLVLLDPSVQTGLEPLLAQWGVRLQEDWVVDPTSGLGGMIPIVTGYSDHEVTRKFDMATFFPLARSVTESGAAGFRFEPILKTGPSSWRTVQMKGDITLDPARDQKGPITIGAVVRKEEGGTQADADAPDQSGATGHADGASPAASKARLVVIGDADFATNAIVRSAGNGDLFQNAISWLAEEKDLVSIRPKEGVGATLLLSVQQDHTLFAVSVLILPVAILVSGLTVWRRRRRL